MNKTNIREQISKKEKKSLRKNRVNKNILKISLILLFVIIIILLISNRKMDVDENTAINKLNPNRYNKEIIELYNRDGQAEEFLKEMNRVQTLIGMYVISNSSLKENSFSDNVKILNKEINNDTWQVLESEKSIYYNGEYVIDENGNLKFKFGSKSIEPEWINDESISRYVILN